MFHAGACGSASQPNCILIPFLLPCQLLQRQMITAPDFNDAHTGESEDLESKCQQLLCSYIELIGSWWEKKDSTLMLCFIQESGAPPSLILLMIWSHLFWHLVINDCLSDLRWKTPIQKKGLSVRRKQGFTCRDCSGLFGGGGVESRHGAAPLCRRSTSE